MQHFQHLECMVIDRHSIHAADNYIIDYIAIQLTYIMISLTQTIQKPILTMTTCSEYLVLV